MSAVVNSERIPNNVDLGSDKKLKRALYFDIHGNPLTKEEWERRREEWLPSAADEAYIQSLMKEPLFDPKQMANWIAPPPRGIKGCAIDFQYVRRQA